MQWVTATPAVVIVVSTNRYLNGWPRRAYIFLLCDRSVAIQRYSQPPPMLHFLRMPPFGPKWLIFELNIEQLTRPKDSSGDHLGHRVKPSKWYFMRSPSTGLCSLWVAPLPVYASICYWWNNIFEVGKVWLSDARIGRHNTPWLALVGEKKEEERDSGWLMKWYEQIPEILRTPSLLIDPFRQNQMKKNCTRHLRFLADQGRSFDVQQWSWILRRGLFIYNACRKKGTMQPNQNL